MFNKTIGLVLFLHIFSHAQSSVSSSYNILKLPPGTNLSLDADITKWPAEYFIDSLRSNANVYAQDDSIWTRADFQMKVYAAYADSNVYFAVKIISDDLCMLCGNTANYFPGCDNIKINPGGNADAFYLWSGGALFRNSSCPWQPGVDINTAVNSHGGENGLPSYEFSIARHTELLRNDTFLLSVGTDDEDAATPTNEAYEAIGVNYLGNKKLWNGQWNNQLYYPTFTLSSTVGPALTSIEGKNKQVGNEGAVLSVTPNPLNSVANISFANPNHNATIMIMDIKGRTVACFNNLTGNKITWNGRNEPNGAYFVKLTAGKNAVTQRICLIR